VNVEVNVSGVSANVSMATIDVCGRAVQSACSKVGCALKTDACSSSARRLRSMRLISVALNESVGDSSLLEFSSVTAPALSFTVVPSSDLKLATPFISSGVSSTVVVVTGDVLRADDLVACVIRAAPQRNGSVVVVAGVVGDGRVECAVTPLVHGEVSVLLRLEATLSEVFVGTMFVDPPVTVTAVSPSVMSSFTASAVTVFGSGFIAAREYSVRVGREERRLRVTSDSTLQGVLSSRIVGHVSAEILDCFGNIINTLPVQSSSMLDATHASFSMSKTVFVMRRPEVLSRSLVV